MTFDALTAAAAVGFEVRRAEPGLRISSALLLTLNALVLAYAGFAVLSEDVSQTAGHAWLGALGATHATVGLGAVRLRRVSHELGLTALAIAAVLANVTFASVVDRLPMLAGWVVAGVGFAALLPGAAPRGAHAARRHGRQGLPLRPLDAELDLPRGVVHRARPAAARRRVRVAADAPPRAARPAGDAGGPALTPNL